jgi:hypothetical protein
MSEALKENIDMPYAIDTLSENLTALLHRNPPPSIKKTTPAATSSYWGYTFLPRADRQPKLVAVSHANVVWRD